MIALIDYDAGNIKSVEKAFQSLGKEVVLTRDPEVLKRADHVVLPGVGSFAQENGYPALMILRDGTVMMNDLMKQWGYTSLR